MLPLRPVGASSLLGVSNLQSRHFVPGSLSLQWSLFDNRQLTQTTPISDHESADH
jgi:hypothetical protein